MITNCLFDKTYFIKRLCFEPRYDCFTVCFFLIIKLQ